MHSFGDIVIDNGTKKETAKALTEEEITGALVRVLKTGLHMACFVNGSGEHTLEDTDREGYSSLKEQLEKNNYKTQTISLIEKPEVPKSCTIVVVAGPKRDYLQPEIDAIRNFVKDGGRAMFDLDPVLNLPDQKTGDTPALDKLVEEYGVTPKDNVILDLGAASRLFGQLSPVVGSYESHAIVRPMQDNATVYPLARGLEVKAPAEKLFSSTADSSDLSNPKPPISESRSGESSQRPVRAGRRGHRRLG